MRQSPAVSGLDTFRTRSRARQSHATSNERHPISNGCDVISNESDVISTNGEPAMGKTADTPPSGAVSSARCHLLSPNCSATARLVEATERD